MSAIAPFAKLRAIGYPYLTTREAAAELRASASSASRTLRTLSAHGAHRACPTRSLAVRRAKPRCTAGCCGGDATVSGLYLVCLGVGRARSDRPDPAGDLTR